MRNNEFDCPKHGTFFSDGEDSSLPCPITELDTVQDEHGHEYHDGAKPCGAPAKRVN